MGSALAIHLTTYDSKECEGSVTLDASYVDEPQCNNYDSRPPVGSAEATDFGNCFLLLYSEPNCPLDGPGLEMGLSQEGVCVDAPSGVFNLASYEVQCM